MVINPFGYLRESKAELDKVIWPTKRETLRLTVVVVIVSVIIGAYISGLDAMFATLVEKLLALK